jgi:hypothetical protein
VESGDGKKMKQPRVRVAWKLQLLRRRCLFAWLGPLLLVQTLAACSSIGPRRLENDQLDYSRTLSDVDKRQTLFNLVRLRYADTPMFASVQQMVAGYTLQGTVQAGLQTSFGPIASSTFGTGQGAVQYTDRPTFTFAAVHAGAGGPSSLAGGGRPAVVKVAKVQRFHDVTSAPQPEPAAEARESAVVAIRSRKHAMLAHLLEDLTPEEHRRRGDAADALFREVVRRTAGRTPP